LLVEAFAEAIRRRDVGHKLVILGDGPERTAVEAAIKRNAVADRVILAGFKSYDHLPSFYGLADAFAHVALTEQWGLVVNEAAASGLPLIVSETCGAGAVLVEPGRNGWRIDPQDPASISRVLIELFVTTQEQRFAMGAESRKIASAWGPMRFAEGLGNACNAALSEPARALPIWDRTLFKGLASRKIERVS
jgi:glycosyltransferase involved in cell wall biosynthesis